MNADRNDDARSEHGASAAPRRWRAGAFAAVVIAGLVGSIGYGIHAARRVDTAESNPTVAPMAVVPIDALPAPPDGNRPYVLFRSNAPGTSYGRVSLTFLDAPQAERRMTTLQCERVHFAAGQGICLEARRGALTTYHAHLFDRQLAIRHTLALAGPPSRARLSPDGRLAAVTVFVTGHGYGSPGFTTRTSVIDTATGQFVLDDFEKLEVQRDGRVVKAADFNFWGVTFARAGTAFHATLGTGGKAMLIQGDLATRRAHVVIDDVECPSISPDNTRVAFKRRIATGSAGRVLWRLHVLELATGRITALAKEARNVDDQVEWLNNGEVLYALPAEAVQASASTDTWAMPIDGLGVPRKLLPMAFSPTVVR